MSTCHEPNHKVLSRNAFRKICLNASEIKKSGRVRIRLQREGRGSRKDRLARIGLNT